MVFNLQLRLVDVIHRFHKFFVIFDYYINYEPKKFNCFHFILVFLGVIGVTKGPCGGITLAWNIKEVENKCD